MKTDKKYLLMLAGAVVLVGGVAMAWTGSARAQSSIVTQAIANGTVGEQADGYLGVKGSVPANVKAEVDSINIKRRAAYTDLAAKRGVTVADVAAATGCKTLSSRVQAGQSYRLNDGSWHVKGPGPIALPDYCATTG
ncbi:YdbL family protein [Rhizorhapis sp.]|uniref:YdbL family protein n=1 Tax=Rhizorhapis sp. TaxID=1968842 RepID=UPI002B48B17E|nr:YdbL family protein [Rhizorhapis sp.]HKR16830.1 YdbL family protein [Rhizorhapis sp.]